MSITLKTTKEDVEFASVAEVFNKNGNNTTREFRNKFFGSYLTDKFDSAIKLDETIKARKALLEGYIDNLNKLEDALKSAVADEQYKSFESQLGNMNESQLDALASAIQQQRNNS